MKGHEMVIDSMREETMAPEQQPERLSIDKLNAKIAEHKEAILAKPVLKRGDIVEVNELGLASDHFLKPGQHAVVISQGKVVTDRSGDINQDLEIHLFDVYGGFIRMATDSRFVKKGGK